MTSAALFGLVGFFVGIVLHVFLLQVVLKRRKQTLERVLLLLLGGLLVWYAGNFVGLLLRQLSIEKTALLLTWVDVVSFSGLSLLPALLLHTHWVYYREHFSPRTSERRAMNGLLAAMYGVLVLLPPALSQLLQDPSIHPVQKLGPFKTPFLILLAVSYYGCAFLQIRVLQRSRNPLERVVFQRLIGLFFAIPIFNFVVFRVVGTESEPADLFWVNLALLASLFPTFVVAYYIYRHRFLQITVHRSLASALVILVIILSYMAGIRSFGQYLEEELEAPALLLEGTFLVALLLLFPPLSQWVENWVSRAFSREIRQYRQLANRIGYSSSVILSSNTLKEFIERTLEKHLPNCQVRIHLDGRPKQADESQIYPLRSADRELGFLEILRTDVEDSPGHREGIRVLANEISVALERSQLLERQLAMERELAHKTQLEDLGKMAATIAHNVKNPLSSMKTLLQLQGEAENLTVDQRSEIEMMLQEIDRLAGTVTNLLRFSRLDPSASETVADEEVKLRHLLDSLHTVFRGNLEANDLTLNIIVEGTQHTVRSNIDALKDILSNLLKNAIEASPRGSEILLRAAGEPRKTSFSVQDEGPGIPTSLQSKIWDPFFTTKSTGTGLGLAIVHRRLEQIDGKIELKSPLNERGTRITILIPNTGTGRASAQDQG
jgi:signal transduction histidine kinase